MPIDVFETSLLLFNEAGVDQAEIETERVDARLSELIPDASDSANSMVLALASNQCMVFSFSNDQSHSIKSRSLLVYELEDRLPLDAEDLAVARVSHGEGELVLSVDSNLLKSLCEAVERHGVYLRSITPLVLLAIAGLARERDLTKIDVVFWASTQGADLVELRDGRPINWRWIACDDVDSIRRAVQETVEHQGMASALLLGEAPSWELSDEEELTISTHVGQQVDYASAEARRIVLGRTCPIADLREGPLQSDAPYRPISTQLKFAALALIACQLLLVAAFTLWSYKYRLQATSYHETSSNAFERVFPGSDIPVGIKARLESEHRRLLGTKGLASKSIPTLGSVLPVSHAFLSALPEGTKARFEFERIELAPGKIMLATGTARSFEDQETIARSLRIAGFVVPPLSAETRGDGVGLRLESTDLIGEQAGSTQ